MYESMIVLYGNMARQEIEKKMVNFITQMMHMKDDHVCRSFLYILGMDDTDPSCLDLTAFDNHLYLKLIRYLSKIDKPLNNISLATTNLSQISENLPIIFKKYYLPMGLSSKISNKIRQIVVDGDRNISLFFCCVIVIREILYVRKILKESFSQFMLVLVNKNSKHNSL